MGKRSSDDFELDMDRKGETGFGGMILLACLCVLGVCALVFYLNRSSFVQNTKLKEEAPKEQTTEAVSAEEETANAASGPASQNPVSGEASPGGLTASDLDFWDMYPVTPEAELTELLIQNPADAAVAVKNATLAKKNPHQDNLTIIVLGIK